MSGLLHRNVHVCGLHSRESLTPGSSCQFSIQGSESSVDDNADGDVECSATEADQEMDEDGRYLPK